MSKLTSKVVDIHKRRTSIRLTPAEWRAIDTICEKEKINRKKLFELIETNKDTKLGLTSSIRLFTITYYRNSYINIISPTPAKQIYSPVFEAIQELT
ncbi:MAG: ribbon-helix-helix domain-containing protein [Alphaproteobacteria bacterium]|nr:ribbon-helix-helix domain-containing protein [Alphaproteobacteria bacterium]